MSTVTVKDVLDFWFDKANQPYWFEKNDKFDNTLKEKFLATLEQAKQGELNNWRTTTQGRLAEIIVLDQFSRNIYRDTPDAFAQDGMALVLSQEIIQQVDFKTLSLDERNFALMPMMHSESANIHAKAVPLFEQYASKQTLDFEYKHKAMIDKYGRYPQRNAILGRKSSKKEIEFLNLPNSSF